jgi:hypothetical protein
MSKRQCLTRHVPHRDGFNPDKLLGKPSAFAV